MGGTIRCQGSGQRELKGDSLAEMSDMIEAQRMMPEMDPWDHDRQPLKRIKADFCRNNLT